MQTAAGSARVGTRRVRALLDSDRRSANEVRPDAEEVRLHTAEYRVPLRVYLKHRFREDERVRIGSLVLSAGIVMVLLGGLVSALGTARASHHEDSALLLGRGETMHVRSRGSLARGTARFDAVLVSYQPLAAGVQEAPAPEQRGVRDRLRHARRVLRLSGAEGAIRARTLLEDLVRDRPKDGRAYATLAEACLQLSDARCARDAVTQALAWQPRRAKYRALAGRIERAFASSAH
jgi:hypothetical protein